MKRGRKAWQRPENWAGLLMTIAFHAACAALLQATWPPPGRSPPSEPVPRFAYMIEPETGPGPDAWDRDPRALRSPVLFALPTAAGFSPARRRYVETLPSLRMSGADDLLLGRMPVSEEAKRLHPRTASEVADTFRTRWAAIDTDADPFFIPHGAANPLWVEWPDGAPEWVSGLPLELKPLPAPGERAWDAAALVHVSEAGEVSSVFLTRATPDRERNDAIVRALRKLRAAPGRAGRYAVNVYYYPAPVADRADSLAP